MIDTHCHIDDEQYTNELTTFLETQQQDGVEAIIVPGVDEKSVDTILPLCRQYPRYLYPALGLHPENIRQDWPQQLEHIRQAILSQQLTSTPIIAIGEIGLDYHGDNTFRTIQQEVLRQQMTWAQEDHLPVIIHNREATEDTLRILKEFPSVKGVMHCFSGSVETARQVLALGYKLGIGGILTFKNCHLSDTLRDISLSSLVLETDAPYMSPVPHRGQRNESRWMRYVVKRLAEIYSCSEKTIEQATNAQARALFEIK